jgi:hypothetical protein
LLALQRRERLERLRNRIRSCAGRRCGSHHHLFELQAAVAVAIGARLESKLAAFCVVSRFPRVIGSFLLRFQPFKV